MPDPTGRTSRRWHVMAKVMAEDASKAREIAEQLQRLVDGPDDMDGES